MYLLYVMCSRFTTLEVEELRDAYLRSKEVCLLPVYPPAVIYSTTYLKKTSLYIQGEGFECHCTDESNSSCQDIQDFWILADP